MGYTHLSRAQRSELAILLAKGYSRRSIAKAICVNVSTVSRELIRNANAYTCEYNPQTADQKKYVRRKFSKYQGMKIHGDKSLENYVINGLMNGWTPEQISGRLRKEHRKVLGFKSIYTWLYSVQGQNYSSYLPSKRYQPKRRKGKKVKRQLIPDRISIELRPKIIDKRKRIGDFEGDTMGKPQHSPETLVALVDRKSRYLLAKKVQSLRYTVDGFDDLLPCDAKSLTLDNGIENVGYRYLKIRTYFCHPYSSWEKGTVENTFKRLRRYIPKKTRLETVHEKDIAAIVKRMNNTPRKCLGFQTPAEVFMARLKH